MKGPANGDSEVAGPLVFVVAGEPSGDVLGARLMAALRAERPVRFAGVGGPRMTEQGLCSLFPMEELSIMGFIEVLPHVPRLLGRLRQTVAEVRRLRPAALVTIDSPGFNFRLAKRLKNLKGKETGLQDMPLIHYVAPSVWVWRPGRARDVAGFLDHLLALLPFEPPYFEAHGLGTTFTGHPVVESGLDQGDGPAFRRRHGLPPDAPLMAVLPGSRRGEVRRLLPVFAATLGRLKDRHPGLQAVVPTLPHVAGKVAAAAWPIPALVMEAEGEKADALAACDVALAASGTVALELAMARVPSVIAYRMNPLSIWLGRRFIRARFANLVNVILDREAVPEYLQERCRPRLLAASLQTLLDDSNARRVQAVAAAEALERLGLGGPPPSRRAARAVWGVIGQAG